MSEVDFRRTLSDEFANREDCQQLLRQYFSLEGKRYTGSQFEVLCDSAHPNTITARDLVAVETLSVDIPIRPALWILSDVGEKSITALLEKTSPATEIWHDEAETALAEGGPLWTLWDLLSNAYWPATQPNNHLAQTRISKLLATKRPRLSPVLDSVITEKVFPNTKRFWDSFRFALSDESLRNHIEQVTDIPEVPTNVSLLRRIDVVLWTRHNSDD
jgi:hypothetical protein